MQFIWTDHWYHLQGVDFPNICSNFAETTLQKWPCAQCQILLQPMQLFLTSACDKWYDDGEDENGTGQPNHTFKMMMMWKIKKTLRMKNHAAQCFCKRNHAMQTWRSKAFQWKKRDLLRPKCGPNSEFLRIPSCYFRQNAIRSLKSTFCDKSAMLFIMEGLLYNAISQEMHALTASLVTFWLPPPPCPRNSRQN